ncbi:MAG: hypothetical protein ACP5IL_14055 [Syntrophobacteraceae bacterium]
MTSRTYTLSYQEARVNQRQGTEGPKALKHLGPKIERKDQIMHDHHDHSHDHSHQHGEEPLETARFRKMVQHWISHNEDHAGSYRQWASRARDAGHEASAAILEQIASEAVKQNEKFVQIIELLDSSK